MAYEICTCGKPIVKFILRNGLVAFYDSRGNEIRNCSHCGKELKGSQGESKDSERIKGGLNIYRRCFLGEREGENLRFLDGFDSCHFS
jgi:hypothetical protein